MLLYRKLRYGYTFRRIRLSWDKFAIVDPEDFERLSQYNWYSHKSGKNFYALRTIKKGKKRSKEYMHRAIRPTPDDMYVDHKNRNTMDNRKANLRRATHTQNVWNRDYGRNNGSSIYIGVSWCKRDEKWLARIGVNGIAIHLGRYKDEAEAARAFDKAAKKHRGEFAVLNFGED
ncbi:MAG: HNH endonuclease [Sedimentisphaerales bacterium]|nr:HNH endonuclease [Sedimentisphaerales bacterium]